MTDNKSGHSVQKKQSTEDKFRKAYELFDYYVMYWLALVALSVLAVDDVLQHLNSLQHLNINAKYGIAVVVVGIVLSKLYRRKR